MKNWKLIIILVTLATVPREAIALTEPHDTVYFYETWEQILYNEPVAMYVDPYIDAYNYAVDFETVDHYFNENIKNKFIAANIGDSTWLVSSHYLYKNFKVDLHYLNYYVPLFFNEKMAYTLAAANVSFKDLVAVNDDSDLIDYYYIDFLHRKVQRVTPTALSQLLEDYHDLQMRYEGMKDYKKRNVIEDYFFKYIDRATDDVMKPYILELVK